MRSVRGRGDEGFALAALICFITRLPKSARAVTMQALSSASESTRLAPPTAVRCRLPGATTSFRRRAQQRFFHVLRRHRDDRFVQARVSVSPTDDASVAEISTAIGVKRLNLGRVVG